jgi:hypothetical protein
MVGMRRALRAVGSCEAGDAVVARSQSALASESARTQGDVQYWCQAPRAVRLVADAKQVAAEEDERMESR